MASMNETVIDMIKNYPGMIYRNSMSNSLENNEIIRLIKKLPEDTEVLKINSWYCDLDFGILPRNLKVLYISSIEFNSSLENLPDKLECLYIKSCNFNKYINNLPVSLKVLCIKSMEFNQELDNLPKNLEKLVVYVLNKYKHKLNKLPLNIKELVVSHYYERLYPSSIIRRWISSDCVLEIDKSNDWKKENFLDL